MSKPIFQEVVLPATPDKVYKTLMNSQLHSAFTGSPADINPIVGVVLSVMEII